MRTFGAALLATALIATSAFAAPLLPGKPAGVKKAQAGDTNTVMIVAGVGIVGLGIGLAAASGDGDAPKTAPTTTTTTTTTTS